LPVRTAEVRLTPDPSTLTLGEVLRRATDRLAASGSPTARLDAELLLGKALGMERIELYMHLDRPLGGTERAVARELVGRRARREPLQYVLGEWQFRRLTLAVDRRALIPRPETEIVVERCLALLVGTPAPAVLDVGTGSGAIALSIAHEHPGARVTGIDVSDDALSLAAENMARVGVEVALRRHDLFDGLPEGPWDLVVSNPPYVPPEEMPELDREVAEWEPANALVAAGHTEAVVRGAASALRPGGALVLETHWLGAAAAASLLEAAGFRDVRVTNDLAGRERVVEARVGVGRAGEAGR
jgi:release factor glutamine methyltransferase